MVFTRYLNFDSEKKTEWSIGEYKKGEYKKKGWMNNWPLYTNLYL